jgi:sugar lactone lactonase YvrE
MQASPAISGAAVVGQALSASTGSWTGSPTSYAYKWRRCNATGAKCTAIAGATASTYTVAGGDLGSTLRVYVTASNSHGHSKAALSAQTAVVSSGEGVRHLEYIVEDGLISVYSMDEGQKLVKTISLPQTDIGIRGVMASPSTHMLFISYGSDGTEAGGWVLAYDLLTEKAVWTVQLKTGIDSGAVSPDGKTLYMPTGENTPSGIWNIMSTSNGAVTGTIQAGNGAHDGVASQDGRYVYLGGRNYDYLDIYETATAKVREVGPLKSGVRPFTVNGSDTLAYTTATGFDGFQVSSLTSGKVLDTVSFGSVPGGFPYTAPSHGISLSPNEKELDVIDSVNKEVHVYNVAGVAEGVAPRQTAVIPVPGLSGEESSCAYDCGRSGWLQHSLDGRFVYVGDSGEVIETASEKVLTNLSSLAQTKKFLEIDWQKGVPIATSGRLGVGQIP